MVQPAATYPLGPRLSGSTPTATTVAAGDVQRLTGATTTTARNAIPFPEGSYVVLRVAATAVRIRFGAADTVAAAATDVYLPAGASRLVYITAATRYVSVRSAVAGGGAYELHAYVDASSIPA